MISRLRIRAHLSISCAMLALAHLNKFPPKQNLHCLKHRLCSRFDQTWKSCDFFLRLYKSTQRAMFTNVLIFRHTGLTILRRLNERYWKFHKTLRSDSRLFQVEHILLGGCLISFAQDKITDDEVLNTMKNFSVYKDSKTSEKESGSGFISESTSENKPKMEACLSDIQSSPNMKTSLRTEFPIPPLTAFIRQLRQNLYDSAVELFQPQPISSESTQIDSEVLVNTSDKQKFDASLSNILANLNIQSDGTGFIDATWDLVLEKPEMRVWRRPLLSPFKIDHNNSGNGRPNNNGAVKYEYRVCGQYDDISALSFLEVQLNLAYRHYWDDRIISLDYINTADEDESCGILDTIRWVVRFPFPMANREYVYIRRWWLETTSPNISTPHPIQTETNLGRNALVISRSVVLPSRNGRNSNGGANITGFFPSSVSSTEDRSNNRLGWNNPLRQNPIQVADYRSEMLICSNGPFDQLGLTYYLVYYDDPYLPVGDSALKSLSGKAMDRFMNQLHNAALQLDRHGLMSGIDPVVFRPSRLVNQATSPNSTECSNVNLRTDKKPSNATSAPGFYTNCVRF